MRPRAGAPSPRRRPRQRAAARRRSRPPRPAAGPATPAARPPEVRLGVLHQLDDERGVRRLRPPAARPPRRAAPRRTRGSSPACGSGWAVGLRHRHHAATCRPASGEHVPSVASPGPQHRARPRRVAPPAKTPSRRATRALRLGRAGPSSSRPPRAASGGAAARCGRRVVSRRNRSSRRAAISSGRERAQPGGGQLDRQRQPVEAPADLGDGGPHGGGRARTPGRTAAARSANRRTASSSASASTGCSTSPGHRRAARGWWRAPAGPGRRSSSVCDERGDGVDEVLAVVEHEQRARAVRASAAEQARVGRRCGGSPRRTAGDELRGR